MKKEEFSHFLMRRGKKANVITGLVKMAEQTEKVVGKELDAFSLADLEKFLAQAELKHIGLGKKIARSLTLYYKMTGEIMLCKSASDFRESAIARTRSPLALKEFIGINPGFVLKFKAEGILNGSQLLACARTETERHALAQKMGIPYAILMECVRMADLSRIPGVKQIRARLYVDMGVDTVEKMASCSPEDLVEMARAYVKRTRFTGIPTLPAEARFTVITARAMPRVVEYGLDG